MHSMDTTKTDNTDFQVLLAYSIYLSVQREVKMCLGDGDHGDHL